MFEKNATPKHILLTMLAIAWFAVFFLIGCGGGGGGNDDDDDSSPTPSSPVYSELNVSFDDVVLYHFSDQTLSLQNAGSVNFTLGQIDAPALPFSIVNDACSGRTLGPSETCGLQIRFAPTDQGDHEGFFVVPLSGSETNFAGVNLEGTGNGLNIKINQVDTSSCPTVRLIVSVADLSDNFVAGLGSSDFTLVEGVETVGSGTVIPDASNLSVVLALDSSGSVSDVLADIKAAAKAFVDDLDPDDEVAVFRFSDSAAELQPFTPVSTGAGDIKAAIDGIAGAGGSTALYSALSEVCDYFETAPAAYERRAVVIITDGEDTASTIALADAVADAQDTGIPIFTIGLGVDNTEVLQALAGDTGGQYYDAPTEDVLATVYPQIAELLTNQYKIEYESNSAGGAIVAIHLAVEKDGMTGEDSREFEGCSSP